MEEGTRAVVELVLLRAAAFRREVGDGTVTGRAGRAARVGGRWAVRPASPRRCVFKFFLFFLNPFSFLIFVENRKGEKEKGFEGL